MICPTCNVQMHHLNTGGGFSGTDAYQTWDHVKCKKCGAIAIEYYHTQFVDCIDTMPEPFGIIKLQSDIKIDTVKF